jgi:pyruvate ferredoxin oxidoreductase beta subunit/oxalate oxidoreductase subunit beta
MAIEVDKQVMPLFLTDEKRSLWYNPDLPETDPLVAGHRTCAGCGPAIEYRLVLKAAEDNTIAVGPTGCMYVANSSYMNTPYAIPWAHTPIASGGSFTSGVAAGYEAMIRKGKYTGTYPNIICMSGDGSASDIGLGSVSGMLYRNHDALLICYDNEQYANTGIQTSPTTPYGGMTTFTPPGPHIPEGKTLWPKEMARMMAEGHPWCYVATSSVGYPIDMMNKTRKGLNFRGAAYMQVYTPCQKGFVYQTPLTIELGKMVVECGMFPLWEYLPETRQYTYFHPEQKHLVVEYLKLQGRFGHLQPVHIAKLQAHCNKKWESMDEEVPTEFREAEDAEYYRKRGVAAGAEASTTAKSW